MSVHYDLESRYRRLLRFYPRQYRAERGDEIVDTYMEMTSSDRAKPSLADTADIAKGGLRQRLRDSPTGFDDGLRIAAVVAMCTVAVLGADAMLDSLVTALGVQSDAIVESNLFLNIGLTLKTLWLVVGVGAPLLPARITRYAVGTALATTLVVPVLPPFANATHPEPLWFPAVILCGVVALAWPDNPRWWMRALPLAALAYGAAATAGITFLPWYLEWYFYDESVPASLLLVAGMVLVASAIVKRHAAASMWWALAILAAPAAFVAWRPVIDMLSFNNVVTGNAALLAVTAVLLGVGLAIPIAAYRMAHHRRHLT